MSTIGIIVLTPAWIILAIATKIDDSGPVFFKQKRIAQKKWREAVFYYSEILFNEAEYAS